MSQPTSDLLRVLLQLPHQLGVPVPILDPTVLAIHELLMDLIDEKLVLLVVVLQLARASGWLRKQPI